MTEVPDGSQDWAGMDGATVFQLIERHADGWADIRKMMGEWLAANAAPQPQQAAPVAVPAGNWEGAEEWMPLAWELCANECGEEACTELVWEGGPIPEPWGDRWLKYEDQAKEMIALVRKLVPSLAASPQAAPAPPQEAQAGAPGPRSLPTRLSCSGCPALKTEDWTEYLENDGTDRGTYAMCAVAEKNISSYWTDAHPVPGWCPAQPLSAKEAPAPAPQPVALTNADVVEAWRTTEAARSDYGWTSCEWFQAGVRFAQRFYGITQPSQQERT